MSKLDIKIRSKPHSEQFREVFMTLSGTLDATTVLKFEREISTLIATKPHRIVLETAEVNHIHGQAFEILNNANLEQRRHDGELFIINKHEVVESIRLEARDLGGVQIVKLSGHLDIRGLASIEASFLEVFEVPNPQVLVDFSTTDSLSSLGIRMLLQGIKNAAARGGRTLILNPTPPISAALETAGLGHFI
ncbi:MAG: STAS domain-containing protein, partial [Verrucomicrobia bacterium]|nr:STAS domain-containing protein [Verrucomicrobiota bacterium]